MATINRILNKIIVYCGRPSEDSLLYTDMLEILYGRIDYYRTKLGLANRNWLLDKYILDVQKGVEEYNITSFIPNFAKEVYIETNDDTIFNFARRPIAVSNIQDANIISTDVTNPSGFTPTNYGKHAAQAFTFWGFESQQIMCRIIPVPIANCQYRIWYETAKLDDPQDTDAPALMPEFHDLLALHSAVLCLPNCKWHTLKSHPDLSEQEKMQADMQRYQSLISNRKEELLMLAESFQEYRMNNRHERSGTRPAFNRGRGRNRGNIWRGYGG